MCFWAPWGRLTPRGAYTYTHVVLPPCAYTHIHTSFRLRALLHPRSPPSSNEHMSKFEDPKVSKPQQKNILGAPGGRQTRKCLLLRFFSPRGSKSTCFYVFSAPRPRIRGFGPRAGAEGARLYVYPDRNYRIHTGAEGARLYVGLGGGSGGAEVRYQGALRAPLE